jgi:hypothetical protein
MKLITSRIGSYLTGNEIADAVIRYGLALARKHELDVVEIPFLATDGTVQKAQFTVGWQVETAAISRSLPDNEMLEFDSAGVLNAKADRLGVNAARPFSREELAELVSMHVEPAEMY